MNPRCSRFEALSNLCAFPLLFTPPRFPAGESAWRDCRSWIARQSCRAGGGAFECPDAPVDIVQLGLHPLPLVTPVANPGATSVPSGLPRGKTRGREEFGKRGKIKKRDSTLGMQIRHSGVRSAH